MLLHIFPYFLFFNLCLSSGCVGILKSELDEESDVQTAVTVNVSLTLEEIQFVSATNMEYEVTLLLHQRWLDPRLDNNLCTQQKAVNGQIWRPKITLVKGCLKICNNVDDTQFWRGFGSKGNVLLSEKVTIRSSCTRDFRRYPFDIQICELKFGSYVFPVDEIELNWDRNPIKILSRTDLDTFELTNVTTYSEIDVRPSGNFRILAVQFFVKRYFTNYVMSIIISGNLLVTLSYASFWINRERINFRLTMCLSNIAFLIYLHVHSCSNTLINALDLFFVTCLIFLIFSLFGNCLVSYLLSMIHVVDKGNRNHQRSIILVHRWIKILYPVIYLSSFLLYSYSVIY
uniref:Neurotransmitter-gated ion-channel ligand-binding domain-containing protein n=2 Tax=Photinus pyralis TaxID=7054 RepID=A0A1Y1KHJ1_PHOPY